MLYSFFFKKENAPKKKQQSLTLHGRQIWRTGPILIYLEYLFKDKNLQHLFGNEVLTKDYLYSAKEKMIPNAHEKK